MARLPRLPTTSSPRMSSRWRCCAPWGRRRSSRCRPCCDWPGRPGKRMSSRCRSASITWWGTTTGSFTSAGRSTMPCRETLVERLGLANRPDRPFPHDITESDELLQTMRRHKVTARHGDLYDPLSFEGDRDAASLGDALVDRAGQPLCRRGGGGPGQRAAGGHAGGTAGVGPSAPAALGARLAGRPAGADLPGPGAAEAGQDALGPPGRRVPLRPVRPPARPLELRRTWSTGWPGR